MDNNARRSAYNTKLILYAEDEPNILHFHGKFLTGHGYSVLTAETAR